MFKLENQRSGFTRNPKSILSGSWVNGEFVEIKLGPHTHFSVPYYNLANGTTEILLNLGMSSNLKNVINHVKTMLSASRVY